MLGNEYALYEVTGDGFDEVGFRHLVSRHFGTSPHDQTNFWCLFGVYYERAPERLKESLMDEREYAQSLTTQRVVRISLM
jgi:hypothetical protein